MKEMNFFSGWIVMKWRVFQMLLLCGIQFLFAGTTGKFAGTVTDAETGEPLVGVNVTVENTSLGAATDSNGNYTILQIQPGTYSLRASIIGYGIMMVSHARIQIDQSTRIDFQLKTKVIEGESVTVLADRNPIKMDVSTSVTSISSEEVQALPISNVQGVVGMQAGVQGMNIRGSGDDQVLFLLNGVTLRDPRDNKPMATLPLSSVKEVSVQRGGFNAEYGQVQSGIVNVVTNEGDVDEYSLNLDLRYSPPHAKHFGISPFDESSMWLRPYLDDEVCWEGTSNWPRFLATQYPSFDGWNEVSQRTISNSNPEDDLTPFGAQKLFLWQHRKKPVTNQGDYNIDAGFGGPLPVIGKQLGDLRFFTGYRRQRSTLIVPLHRPDYLDYDIQTQITSDISKSIKIRLLTLHGKKYTAVDNWNYGQYFNNDTKGLVSRLSGFNGSGIFSEGYFSPTEISHQSYNLKLTHVLNLKTYYEASLEHLARGYNSYPAEKYDLAKDYELVPGYFVDDAPLGWHEGPASGIDGMMLGGHTCRFRDNSTVTMTTLKADMTSQMNFYNLIKAGFEFVYHTLQMNYGYTEQMGSMSNTVERKDHPLRAAVYAQDKLEANGFILNAGLRLDYSNANTDWYAVGPYDESFFSAKYDEATDYASEKTRGQWQLSPRLGISHPITENSKLFFNYGHFKQMPEYQELFKLDRSAAGTMARFGNPDLILSKTIAYELGYDHSIRDQYLLQLAAYYKDITDQEKTVFYYGLQGVEYRKITSNGYRDTRGLEMTLRKTSGAFWKGFLNYTYQVSTDGYFEGERFYQDPKLQSDYNRDTQNFRQNKPSPTPYARLNLMFTTPSGFGLKIMGFNPLDNLLLNVYANWSSGGYVTYNPLDPSIQNNVRLVDSYNMDLRFEKAVRLNKVDLRFFVDINNVFNFRRMSHLYGTEMASYYDAQDREAYLESLHLPRNIAYDNIPGNDKIGDYRKPGVTFQPVEIKGSIVIDTYTDAEGFTHQKDVGEAGYIYWDRSSEVYYRYENDNWQVVDGKSMDRILNDKAYIDMPNLRSFNFLNPRNIFYGIRIHYHF